MQFLVLLILAFTQASLSAQTTSTAPCAPGNDAHWPSAAKDGFGTANTLASKVWFTLADGVLTEVFYPRLDVPNVEMLQFIVVSPTGIESERTDTVHNVQVPDTRALVFRQINKAKNHAYTITKTYITDSRRPVVLIDVQFISRNDNLSKLYVYYDPSLNNSGMHDTAWTADGALIGSDANIASAIVVDSGLTEITNGFMGVSDGLTELKQVGKIRNPYARANDGNVVQVARIRQPKKFTLALAFGPTPSEALANARSGLARGFPRALREYKAGWHSYLASLASVAEKYQRQFNMSAMVLKALEDKTFRGAMIASPSTPWGGGRNANEATISGYHAVWSRDLYQIATALHAIGDRATANRALDFLFYVQQKPDGSFPQNSWVDGRPIGGGQQLDQVAFPVILAFQLRRTDRNTWLKHLKPAADFIVRNGPVTGQDRWEEKRGYSPATIAAEVAALVCAAGVANLYADEVSAARYRKTADDWVANLERWTVTRNGPYESASYYLRITENGNPNDAAQIEINSGGGIYDQRKIVDAGFLELVRLGIKTADDPLIRESLAIVDKLLKIETPAGPAWYRYNHDAYGERLDGQPYDGQSGVGRLWTLLTGERGEYELARGDFSAAGKLLDAMTAYANEGLMLPEQIWDGRDALRREFRFGKGTGSATPLAWSMAQFLRLVINLQARKNLDTPEIVFARYGKVREK